MQKLLILFFIGLGSLLSSSLSYSKEVIVDLGGESLPPDPSLRNPASFDAISLNVSQPAELSVKANGRMKYYEYSAEGLETYVSDLKKEDPDLAQELAEKLKKIHNQEVISQVFFWGFLGLGGGAIAYTAITNHGLEASLKVGALGVLLGSITSALARPAAREYRSFINHNNGISKKHQLEFRTIGMNFFPDRQYGVMEVSFSF